MSGDPQTLINQTCIKRGGAGASKLFSVFSQLVTASVAITTGMVSLCRASANSYELADQVLKKAVSRLQNISLQH